MIFWVKSHPLHRPHPWQVNSKPLNIPFWFRLPLCGTCWSIPWVLFLNFPYPWVNFSFFIFINQYGLLFGLAPCICSLVFPSCSLCISILLWRSLLQPFSSFPSDRTGTIDPFPITSFYAPSICFWLIWHHPASPSTWPSGYPLAIYDGLILFPGFSCAVPQFYVVLQNCLFVSFIG